MSCFSALCACACIVSLSLSLSLGRWTGGSSLLAEVGTVQLEFVYLSMVTNNPVYAQKAEHVFKVRVRARAYACTCHTHMPHAHATCRMHMSCSGKSPSCLDKETDKNE